MCRGLENRTIAGLQFVLGWEDRIGTIEGGKLALIMDNREEDPNTIVMIGDGRGAQVHIPSVLIRMADGEEIVNVLEKSGGASVVISVSF